MQHAIWYDKYVRQQEKSGEIKERSNVKYRHPNE